MVTPFELEPKLAPAIWGGHALVARYGKRGDPEALLGESWECWDENRVALGAFGGTTLAQLRGELGADLLGPLDPQQRFPVLTKIIDAHAALSVQVHPDDAYAQRAEQQPVGKTECWYILAAEPGAELVLGWARDTDRAEYERRVADGTLGEILRRVPVRAGEAFYLPAGTLHAIGAGIQLFEVQQASDLTYRIFDWNRARRRRQAAPAARRQGRRRAGLSRHPAWGDRSVDLRGRRGAANDRDRRPPLQPRAADAGKRRRGARDRRPAAQRDR